MLAAFAKGAGARGLDLKQAAKAVVKIAYRLLNTGDWLAANVCMSVKVGVCQGKRSLIRKTLFAVTQET